MKCKHCETEFNPNETALRIEKNKDKIKMLQEEIEELQEEFSAQMNGCCDTYCWELEGST